MDELNHNCQHCGESGAVWDTAYVGGVGYVGQWLCQDRSACWDRWDRQHGYKQNELEKAVAA